MSITAAFDSLGYMQRLERAGVPRQQAEAQAEALRDVIEGQLATKRDILELERKLREMEERMTYRLTFRLGGVAIACATLLAALMPMLIHK